MSAADAERMAEEALADDAKVTPGPWESMRSCPHLPDHDCQSREVFAVEPERSCIRASVCTSSPGENRPENLDFIARARTREPLLAKAVLSLSAEVARLREYEALAREARPWLDDEELYRAYDHCGATGEWVERFDALAARSETPSKARPGPEGRTDES
jgi:hypothetical protein